MIGRCRWRKAFEGVFGGFLSRNKRQAEGGYSVKPRGHLNKAGGLLGGW